MTKAAESKPAGGPNAAVGSGAVPSGKPSPKELRRQNKEQKKAKLTLDGPLELTDCRFSCCHILSTLPSWGGGCKAGITPTPLHWGVGRGACLEKLLYSWEGCCRHGSRGSGAGACLEQLLCSWGPAKVVAAGELEVGRAPEFPCSSWGGPAEAVAAGEGVGVAEAVAAGRSRVLDQPFPLDFCHSPADNC